jgi:SpoVK/Ycf46/Vps4 family AAA+-type ATPase
MENYHCANNRTRAQMEMGVNKEAFQKITLPDGYEERIIETLAQVQLGHIIFDQWGLSQLNPQSNNGINILLVGKSGTGKTLCGKVIAEYLGVKRKVIYGSDILSRWVGKSERIVDDLFWGLTPSGNILSIDEVDAFVYSRKRAEKSHEIQLVNQFLKNLESHKGICVMTSNRGSEIDEAVYRRADLILDFPSPDAKARKIIWEKGVPESMPVEEMDFGQLAEYELTGANISNVILSTARKAVLQGIGIDNTKIPMPLFIEAINQELRGEDVLRNGVDHV